VVVGLDLDDDSTDAIEQQRCADQVRRNLKNRAVEKGAGQLAGHAILYRGCGAKGESVPGT
jgi:hypothetical protein